MSLFNRWIATVCVLAVMAMPTMAARAGQAGPADGATESDGDVPLAVVPEDSGSDESVRRKKGDGASPDDEVKPPKKPGAADGFPKGFKFGTYGRVGFSSDFAGAPGNATNIVTHGSRLMEGSYVELDLGYGIRTASGFAMRLLITPAFLDEFFHFDGKASDSIVLRNLYVEASGIFKTDLKIWVGSRMYRGDDIYLLDWWPLDSLNTLGGGLSWDHKSWQVLAHVGVNRLDDEYQLRRFQVPATYGSDTITLMERQRMIASAKVSWLGRDLAPKLSMKVSLYGEFHWLPKGKLRYDSEFLDYFKEFGIAPEPELVSEMPADNGGVVGAQIGFWGFGKDSHVNIFARYAWGLAAYGEWGIPWGVALDRTASGAKEFVLAASSNWENRHFGIMAAAYGRLFVDADSNRYDLDDYWEGTEDVRATWFATDHFHVGAELSHQWKASRGLDPTDDKVGRPHVVQMSLMPSLNLERGMYQRPQIRLVYTASWSNDDARSLLPQFDERRGQEWQHYLGVQVEWWLNSSSYQ
ncbi:MAG TPA: carbohydrate porin [Myxococcota bacterium]|nr:carbohydrate porin [Myxococcota bacterium]